MRVICVKLRCNLHQVTASSDFRSSVFCIKSQHRMTGIADEVDENGVIKLTKWLCKRNETVFLFLFGGVIMC